MPRWLPLLVFLAAVAGVIWLALGSGDGAHDAPGLEATSRVGGDGEAPALRTETGRSLRGTTPRTDPATPRTRRWPVVPSDEIPRGGLEVVVLGPDLEPVPAKGLKVHLERIGAAFWGPPLGVPDPDTHVWSFRNVVWGRVRVHVTGDHVVDATREADVPKNAVERVEIAVDRGGAIYYRAKLLDGKPPSSVTLKLVSARTKKTVEARYQARGIDLTQDRRAKEITQAAEGIVFGIRPGRYVLHATSAEGDTDQVAVKVEAGKTEEVEFSLRF